MIFFTKYIEQFSAEGSVDKKDLSEILSATRLRYAVSLGGDPVSGFGDFVERYNWLGRLDTKAQYGITQNLARNLPGAMFQDYLLSLASMVCKNFPDLEVFTEVRVPFGRYPIWSGGDVEWAQPSERSDIAIGYRMVGGEIVKANSDAPREPVCALPQNTLVLPVVTINSKIRVSQSEFFDWHGREQLMTKGNPNCFSAQVALRKEMDLNIVEAAQAGEKFFLLGTGGERDVRPNPLELSRFIDALQDHLSDRMLLTRE